MSRFLITPVAAMFFFCLLFIFSLTASAGVTNGKASCPEGKIEKIGNGVGCVIPLPVHPAPEHGGGGSSPSDWGMCGVLNLSANFGPPTVARIIVDPSGHYAVELVGYTASVIPTLNWTCVLFSDFKRVPAMAEARSTAPSSYNGHSGGSENIAASPKNACIWAGLSGNLETIIPSQDNGAFGYAYAQYVGPDTVIGSENVTTYAFCSGYAASGWTGWKYFHHGIGAYEPLHVTSIGVKDTQYWCYMDRIDANLLYPTYSVGLISAGLSLSGGNYSMDATPAGGVYMNYNCLPLEQ